MVLKKQNGMRRGQAVILAACICTDWVRLSECPLGKRKNHRIKDFGPSMLLGVQAVCRARSTALECVQRADPAAVRGGRRDSSQGEAGLQLPARRWGR